MQKFVEAALGWRSWDGSTGIEVRERVVGQWSAVNDFVAAIGDCHQLHLAATFPAANLWFGRQYQYYGVNDNWPLLMAYRARVRLMAKRHLSRRSQQSYLNWSDLNRFTEAHPLASPVRLTDLIALGRQRSSGRDK